MLLLRILDASISYLFKFVTGCGPLLTGWQALNMNNMMSVLIAVSVCLIPIAGIIIYEITLYVSKKWPLRLTLWQMFAFAFMLTCALVGVEWSAKEHLTSDVVARCKKALPFGITFLPAPVHIHHLKGKLRELGPEVDVADVAPIAHKPNIYLFVIEALRKDFIDAAVAPRLHQFAGENTQFKHSFACANATQLSWFSIFQSRFPYHLPAAQKQWQKGSAPLRMLAQLGYEIRIYASANFDYFGMDKALFGHGEPIGHRVKTSTSVDAATRDASVLEAMHRDVETKREGHVFLAFLDATHSEYSFPADFPAQFHPMPEQIDYLTLTKESVEPLKNRYRNAIAYIDSLIGSWIDKLKIESLYDTSIMIVTADHGEEFCDDGAFFHATHLNTAQTSVPLYCKFPPDAPKVQTHMATHVDIFPSILHYLTGSELRLSAFDGQSIFTPSRWPYHLCVSWNGSYVPVEFSIETENAKLLGRFLVDHEQYAKEEIEVLSVEDASGDTYWKEALERHFPHAFDRMIEKNSLSKDKEDR
jgi:hypothetical protein